jgi:hypothetical protein
VSGVDYVHDVCSLLRGVSICLSIGTASSVRQQDQAESGMGGLVRQWHLVLECPLAQLTSVCWVADCQPTWRLTKLSTVSV